MKLKELIGEELLASCQEATILAGKLLADPAHKAGLPLFAVLTLKHPGSAPLPDGFKRGRQYIVTHNTTHYGDAAVHLLDEGGTKHTQLSPARVKASSMKAATPGQVLKCICTLTDAQWQYVMKNDSFAPIMAAVMSRDFELTDTQSIPTTGAGEPVRA